MGHNLILTDNAAQFTRPNFPGCKFVRILDEEIEHLSNKVDNIRNVRVGDFPKHINTNNPMRLALPTTDYISNQILSLYQSYDDIFIALVSKNLHPLYDLFEEIIKKIHGKAEIHLLDTQSIAIGEGQIVQIAAELIEKNIGGSVIEERLREAIPHVYTLLCTPNFSYLNKSGFIDLGQAVSGEVLGFLPIFTLEDGKLNPVEKVKNIRSAFDYFIEFIEEYEEIGNISFIQPASPAHNESKLIRQHVEEFFPKTQYSEHTINPFLASLIGPQGMGIVITESYNS